MSAWKAYVAVAAAGCVVAAGMAVAQSGRGGIEDPVIVRSADAAARGSTPSKGNRARNRECRKRLYKLIRAYPTSKTPLDSGSSILYHAYPLSGPYDKAVFDSIGSKVVAFLSGRGAARKISAAGLDSCLADTTGGCGGFRYVVTPFTTVATSKEKSVGLEKFVKLDTAGNFVPAHTSSTLTSVETELWIRFVAVDLKTKEIVFNGRIVKKTSSERTLEREISGRSPPSGPEKNGAGTNENAYRAADKLLRKLASAFNG